jgi:hypothetical protein
MAREDRSSDSKVDRSRRQEKHHRGKRPRVVISSRSRKVPSHESEERLQSSETRGLSKGLEPPERRCPRPRRPVPFTRYGARVGLGRLRMNALEIARGPLEADDRRQRRYVTRTVGKTTPRDASITDRPKHARRRESPSDLVRCRKAKGFRNRTTRRLPVHHRDGHTLVVRISSPALLDETLEVATPRVAGRTTMAPHANALHALHGPERGRDVRSRDRSPPEGSVVRGAQSGQNAVTRKRPDSRARERFGTTRRRRSVRAYEWSKPPPYVRTWFSRFTAVCVGASRMHMAQ